MSENARSDTPPASSRAPVRLDAERLDVYTVALEFQARASGLVPRRRHGVLRDQLERASLSIVLNLAEANARVSAGERAHLYAIARGSAAECGAIVDILRARGLASDAELRAARERIVRLVQMLTGLLKRCGRSPTGEQGP